MENTNHINDKDNTNNYTSSLLDIKRLLIRKSMRMSIQYSAKILLCMEIAGQNTIFCSEDNPKVFFQSCITAKRKNKVSKADFKTIIFDEIEMENSTDQDNSDNNFEIDDNSKDITENSYCINDNENLQENLNQSNAKSIGINLLVEKINEIIPNSEIPEHILDNINKKFPDCKGTIPKPKKNYYNEKKMKIVENYIKEKKIELKTKKKSKEINRKNKNKIAEGEDELEELDESDFSSLLSKTEEIIQTEKIIDVYQSKEKKMKIKEPKVRSIKKILKSNPKNKINDNSKRNLGDNMEKNQINNLMNSGANNQNTNIGPNSISTNNFYPFNNTNNNYDLQYGQDFMNMKRFRNETIDNPFNNNMNSFANLPHQFNNNFMNLAIQYDDMLNHMNNSLSMVKTPGNNIPLINSMPLISPLRKNVNGNLNINNQNNLNNLFLNNMN